MKSNFPLIEFSRDSSPKEWGNLHGEAYRDEIKELSVIRRELMREKNATLTDARISKLAVEQWEETKLASPDLSEEILGISEGAAISIEDLVVVNNYTDFRDIHLPEEGCTTAYVGTESERVAGQTWDMHKSARKYACILKVPLADEMCCYIFSHFGCVGLAGMNSNRLLVAINNLTTDSAVSGVLWPVVVREFLKQKNVQEVEKRLSELKIGSGRSFLFASESRGALWEVSGLEKEKINEVSEGRLFHTNHCIGEKVSEYESSISGNSTTRSRYALAEKKIAEVSNFADMKGLFSDHEGYPKSICSHFEANITDPSSTCGGFVGDLLRGKLVFWRGCREYDSDYLERRFKF